MCKMTAKEYSKSQYLALNQTAKTVMIVDQRYHIKNICLAAGKNSKIYVAWDSLEKQVYAVKAISKNSQGSQTSSRLHIPYSFRKEIEIMKILKGQNFVQFFDMREAEQSAYLFMEYCNQGSLKDLCQQEAFLQFEKAMAIFQKLIKACKQMHKQNILHRYIRPQNILLNNGNPKVYGFKKAIKFSNDMRVVPYTGILDQYCAPEIHAKEQPTLKSDIWSLGVTFYKILCGEHPWTQSTGKKWEQKLKKPVEFPKDIYIPLFFKKTLRNMLDYNPESRPCMDLVYDYINY